MSEIIIALDYPDGNTAFSLVEKLGKEPVYKIGMELFNAEGPQFVKKMTAAGYRVFLDLKYHDIPNTVAGAARNAVQTGCFMFNVHAMGGEKMMAEAKKAAINEAEKLGVKKPFVIAVTVLTSMAQEELSGELKVLLDVKDYAVSLALLAKKAGLDGVVASPQEISVIRKACGNDFLLVTPGVRPAWAEANDQKRIMTPNEAAKSGSDYLVIGRPITANKDPLKAYELIKQEMEV